MKDDLDSNRIDVNNYCLNSNNFLEKFINNFFFNKQKATFDENLKRLANIESEYSIKSEALETSLNKTNELEKQKCQQANQITMLNYKADNVSFVKMYISLLIEININLFKLQAQIRNLEEEIKKKEKEIQEHVKTTSDLKAEYDVNLKIKYN